VDSTETEQHEDAPEQETPDAPRWYQRVLPVSAAAVVLLAIIAFVVPAFRDQIALSVSRQSQPYVELYFAPSTAANGQAVCTRKGSAVLVRFVVASHLDRRQAIAYRVTVDPVGKSARPMRKAGSGRVTPGTSPEVRSSFAVPRRLGYAVSVTLPAFGQELRARCEGRRS